MHYLRGKITDVSALEALDEICFPEDINYQKFEIVYYLKRPKTLTYLAKENKELVGFIMAGKFGRRQGKIITIDVHPGWRRKGIGSHLLGLAVSFLIEERLDAIVLEVHQRNHGAVDFYKHHGFQMWGKKRNYYPDGDALTLKKSLV